MIEILLTLTLLVVISALVWPAFRQPFDNMRLRKAGELIRVQWAQARVAAIESAVIQTFRFQADSDQYWIEPWKGDTPARQPNLTPSRLPAGVVFAGTRPAAAMRGTSKSFSPVPAATAKRSTQPILFYPDGTSSTSAVMLRNQHNRYIAIRLRGLVGAARISELLTEKNVRP